ncbi:aldehyde dehydrogenase family protein, partial [Acinetobacter baumannii]
MVPRTILDRAGHGQPDAGPDASGLPLDPGLRRGRADWRGGVEEAITRAAAAFPAWSATPVEARAAILDRLADLLEANR